MVLARSFESSESPGSSEPLGAPAGRQLPIGRRSPHPLRALVLGGGEVAALPSGPWDLIVCADSGAAHALRLGLTPHVLVGDFDSLDPAVRRRLPGRCTVRQFPAEKDWTDGQLAVECALEMGATQIAFAGSLGGRTDHTLANLGLLWLMQERGADGHLTDGRQRVFLLRAGVSEVACLALDGRAGDLVSIVPARGDVGAVWTEGLHWPLRGDALPFGETRPISNRMAGGRAAIRLQAGAAYVVAIPDPGAP